MKCVLVLAAVLCVMVASVRSQAAGGKTMNLNEQRARLALLKSKMGQQRGGGMGGLLPLLAMSGGGGDNMLRMMMFSQMMKGGGGMFGGGQGGMRGMLPMMMLGEMGMF